MHEKNDARYQAPFQALALVFATGVPLAAAQERPTPQLVTEPFAISGEFEARHIEDRENVTVIELVGSYDRRRNGETNVEPRALVAREFLRLHPDRYDFLVVFTTFEFDTSSGTEGGDALAFHLGVRNDVEGIGLPLFDNSPLFGSDGRLQGYIDMAALSRYTTDPLDSRFELVLGTLAHETMHQWCCFVDFEGPDGSPRIDLLGPDDAHWSYLLDSDASVMYGHDWRENPAGSFTAVDIRRFYGPLDLYLAGFLGPDELPPFLLIDQPAIPRTRLPERGAKVTGTGETVTIEDIIAAEGARFPSAADSPKEFRAAFLIVTRPGIRPADDFVAAVNGIRSAFQTRFSVLTGGRAIVHAFPEAQIDGSVGVPEDVEGGPLRDEASLVDGFGWLRSRQTQEGFWEDTGATRLRDTTAALETLAAFDGGFGGTTAALAWLGPEPAPSVDFLARKAATLERLGVDASSTRASLLSLQNADGGWGVASGYASDPVDTALGVLALSDRTGTSPSALRRAGDYLLSSQNPDGGFGNLRGGASRTRATTTVVRALQALGSLGPVQSAALSWLAGRQNPDGGFGDSPSTIHDTADVVQAFADLDRGGDIRSDDAYRFLRSSQSLEGSWGGSSFATALALRALQGGSFPNLKFTGPMEAIPASPRDGERVELILSIGNDGGSPSSAVALRLYDGDPDAGGTPASPDLPLPALPAHRTATVRVLWDSFDKPGLRTVFAVVDAENAVLELSELDNRVSLEIDVKPAPEDADLEIRASDLAVMPAAPDRLPTALALSAQLRNLGKTPVVEATVRLWLGEKGAGVLLDEKTVSLPARSSRVVNFSHDLAAPGTTTFTVEADPDDEVSEANETNNVASTSVTTVASVDLEVMDSDLALIQGAPYLGNDVTFRARIRNAGTVDAPPATARFSITDGVSTVVLATRSVLLGAGETAEHTVDYRVGLLGPLRFVVELDPDGVVPEKEETNNVGRFTFDATELDSANLTTSFKDLVFAPNPALEGSALRISALVRNTGAIPAADVEVAFYDGDPDSGGALLSIQTLASLDPGASVPVEHTVDFVAGAADRLVFFVVDPQKQIAEIDENDNRAFESLVVLGLPDLAVSPGALSLVPRFPRPGDAVTLTVQVTNLGEQPAANVLVRVHEGEPGAGGRQVGGDQVLPAIAPKVTGIYSFSWTLEGDATRTLVVEVDPGSVVVESTKANNVARLDVAVQDSDFFVTERYFSPNGDGVKDTTRFHYRLPSSETVAVEVVDPRGRVVRTSPPLTGAAGEFTWDGLDALGRLVRDRDYRIQVMRGTEPVGAALVTLDTNRSSLMEALGTPFELETNLTCDVTNYGRLVMSKDERWIFFPISFDPFYEPGLYRMTSTGSDLEKVSDLVPWDSLVVDDDGSHVAFITVVFQGIFRYQLWVGGGDGSGFRLLRDTPSLSQQTIVGFIDNGQSILVADRSSGRTKLDALSISGSGSRVLFTSDRFSTNEWVLSPNSKKLLFPLFGSGSWELWLLDLETGGSRAIGGYDRFAWSPDGARIALATRSPGEISFFDSAGTLRRTLAIPVDPFPSELLPDWLDGDSGDPYLDQIQQLSWSSSGTELAFVAHYWAGRFSFGRVLRVDAISGEIETIGWTEPQPNEGEGESSYHVYTWEGSGWVERGVLHYGLQYEEKELDLGAYLSETTGDIRVLIRQTGMEAAHVDRVALRFGALDVPPAGAVHERSGEDVLPLIRAGDFEVLDLHETGVEVRWSGIPGIGAKLVLRAREESLSGRRARPFTYPGDPARHISVALSKAGRMVVDGRQTGEDGLEAPLFEERSRPGTGHPMAVVRGFAKADGEHLYAALDFAVDNTLDGERDWAALLVRTETGWREFRVTASDRTWGIAGFTRTGSVTFTHKYYEFKVPLTELASGVGDVLDVRFQAYGTAAIVDVSPELLPPFGDLLWVPNERTLLFTNSFSSRPSVAIFLDEDNRRQDVFEDANIYDLSFSPSGRQLNFTRSIFDLATVCSDRGSSDRVAISSLANLTADLRARRSSGTGGIRIDGTAADLNFSHYTLEHAPATGPGVFALIEPPSATTVIDDVFTTWVPPGPGTYFVRLTVEDLAGNREFELRRVSFRDTPSITDVYRTPQYISPNGDGVQDEVIIHYRVLEPVHLEFQVYNEAGDRVRTIARDHSVAGTEFDLRWNGIDDRGLPVKDGEYRMVVQSYEFFFKVDTRPPEVELTLFDAYQFEEEFGRTLVKVDPKLDWCLEDENLGESVIETGAGADPATWVEKSRPLPTCLAGFAEEQRDKLRQRTGIGGFVDFRFRIEASDLAGNRSRAVTGLGAEQMIVHRFGRPNRDGLLDRVRYVPMSSDDGDPALFQLEPGDVRIRVTETVIRELVELAIQFRPLTQSFWQETPVTAFHPVHRDDEAVRPTAALPAPPDPRFDILWNMDGIPLGEVVAVRLRSRDLEGKDHFSNPFQVLTDGIRYGGRFRKQGPPVEPPLVLELADQAIDEKLIGARHHALWAIEAVPEPIAEIKLFIQSDDDPRYAAWKSIEPLKVVNGGFIFKWNDQVPCLAYETYVRVITEPTLLPDGRTQVRTFESDRIVLKDPCLMVDPLVEPVLAPSCGAPPPQQLRILVAPYSFSDTPLQILTVGERLPSGDIDVFFNVNRPEANRDLGIPPFRYPFVFDTSDRAEGKYPFVARLTNIDGEEAEADFDIIVDHTPPEARILVPLEGQKVCGIPRETPIGVRNVFDVEGILEDEAGAGYRITVPRVDGRTFEAPLEEQKSLSVNVAHGILGTYGDTIFEPPFSGEAELLYEAFDWGGHRVCVERSFFYDGEVEDPFASLDPALFSPNDDGVLDELQIEHVASELFFTTIDVFEAAEIKPGQMGIRGPSLRRVVTDLQVLDQGVTTWDGRTSSGSVVPDGPYGIVIQFRDACGNFFSITRFVTVDNTPPTVSITYPRTGDPLGMVVEVRGSATDLHFARYTLEYGIGLDPLTWAPIGSNRRERVDEVLAPWNTRGLSGEIELRLSAIDRAGNTAETRVPLNLVERTDVLSYLEAVPSLFSPNGDGRRETTGIRFGLEAAALVTLEVKGGGTTVRTLLEGVSLPEGAHLRPWDGLKDGGGAAADGAYEVHIEAALASNPGVIQREKVTVVVDRLPPTVTVSRPANGFLQAGESIVGTIEDLHLEQYQVSLAENPAAPLWDVVAEGTLNRRATALASPADLEEGDYGLRIEAADEAENQSELVVSFLVDATPPKPDISAPVTGAVLGGKDLDPPVSGTVEEKHLEIYRLQFGAGETPSSWMEIASGTSLPTPEPLARWNLETVPDGRYSVRLFAQDIAGHTAEDRIVVDVDKTPPVVAITTPAEGAILSAPLAILGTASDAHLGGYRLELAPGKKGTASAFSEIGIGSTSITNGVLLDWQTLPADGVYTLRLRAEDVVGLVSETLVEIEIDTTPPEAPLSLVATVENRKNAKLTWSASTAPDLAGYRVYRHGALITPDLVPVPEYLDPDLDEGRYVYRVTAVDRGGLESEPSNEASVAIDTAPPVAQIQIPTAGARVSGLVDVNGTAYSQDDFKEYRLFVGDGLSEPTLLRRSPAPVQIDLLSQWNTVGLPEDGAFTLRLEAEDLSGNVAFHEVAVIIDNLPPAAPTGLVATQQGSTSTVLSTWNPNSEPDLAGYLLYRDGRLVNAEGAVVGDLRRYLIKITQYEEPGVPDGPHVYEVYAMDEAGNLSDPSEPANVTLDTRPPHAVIVFPSDGTAFDAPIHVVATTEDTDVRDVRFQFRALGETAWTDLGDLDTTLPWEIDWDPDGLAYGSFDLQAVATDLGGRTDPAPTPIVVHYRDVTRPGAVLNLEASVDGGDVTLEWTPVNDADLAGYHIDREDALGTEVRITASPVTEVTYIDAGLEDGNYVYRVVAVDTSENEGDRSNDAAARVYTPALEQPYTPTPELSSVLQGVGAALATVMASIESTSGTRQLPEISTDDEGLFAFAAFDLERGDNTFTVRVRDASGNISKPAQVLVVSAAPPSAPTGLAATSPADFDVVLNWTTNPSSESVIGYRPFRSGVEILPEESRSFSSAEASSSWFSSPFDAIDSDFSTYWAPEVHDAAPLEGQVFTASMGGLSVVTGIELDWWFPPWDPTFTYGATDYDVEGDSGYAWVKLASVRGNHASSHVVELARPYRTDRLRIVLKKAIQPAGEFQSVRLAEVRFLEQENVAAPPFEETVTDGRHVYTVTAVNQYGFESVPSDPVELPVGDVEPPAPPVLSASVLASDVTLEWTASPSPDVVRYDLYRDGALLAQHDALPPLIYLDPSLPNAVYRYVVHAVDAAGNVSAPSNEAEAIVDVPPPGAPFDLVVTAPSEGGALDLAWAPGAGPLPASYRVLRSLASGGPYEEVGTTAETTFPDRGLENGVTYFYVVIGLDVLGNESASSNEASGTPRDLVPAAKPVLHHPGYPGAPFRTRHERTLISGRAEPGASVTLSQDGVVRGTTEALFSPETLVAPVPAWDLLLSPTGRHLFASGDYRLFDFDTLSLGPTLPVQGNSRWSADGKELVIARDSAIRAFRVADGSLRDLATLDYAEVAVPSPDGRSLAALGYLGGDIGLFEIDLSSGSAHLLVPGETWWFDSSSIQWSTLGTHVAFRRYTPGYSIAVVTVETGEVSTVEDMPGDAFPDWSPDGRTLLYTSLRDGFEQAWRYDVSSGVASPLTTEPEDHRSPQWSPDGRSLAYVVFTEVRERLLSTGEEKVLFDAGAASSVRLNWVSGGDLLIVVDDAPLRFRPSGWFGFENVLLTPGDNSFTAVAEDTAGPSDASEPMIVVLDVADRPDLDLSLSVLPAAGKVGMEVRVSVAVRNIGEETATPTELSVKAFGPGGFSRTLADRRLLGELAPGALRAVYFDVLLDGPAGAYTVVASADPFERISEKSESNNTVQRQAVTVEGELPSLTVATDRETYASGDLVEVTAEMFNAGDVFNGRVAVIIEDGGGFEVDPVLNREVSALEFNERRAESGSWNSTGIFAGLYRARARLVNVEGAVVAEAVDSFQIASESTLAASVQTDQASYLLGATARIAGTVRYTEGTERLAALVARLRVVDAASRVLQEWTRPLNDLLPGGEGRLQADWATGASGVGPFRAELAVLAGAVERATASAGFDVVLPPVALAGRLSLSDATPSVGSILSAFYRLENKGSTALLSMPVILRVLDPDTAQVVAERESTADVPPGSGAAGSVDFSTAGLALKAYFVTLAARLPGEPQPTKLHDQSFTPVDETPPVVSILAPANGLVTRGLFDGVVRALDGLSQIALVEVRIDGGTWLPAAPQSLVDGRYFRALSILVEGPHQLQARAFDAWENEGIAAPVSFIVDRTPPDIVVTGVQDGEKYRDEVVPVIEITDLHPQTESIRLNGTPFVSGTPVSAVGSYLLEVEAEDAAGNRSTKNVRFEIEGTPSLVARKTDELVEDANGDGGAGDGDVVRYIIQIENVGDGSALDVLLRDSIPANADVVPGSVDTTKGVVTGESPVEVEVGSLGPSETAEVRFDVRIASPIPAGEEFLSNQGSLSAEGLVDVLTDDPDTPQADDPTKTRLVRETGWIFTDETIPSGLGLPGIKTGGLAWCDFNSDGYPDLLVNAGNADASGRSYLYFNNRDRTFRDVTSKLAAGLLRTRAHRSAICGDLNNDGYLDFARNEHGRVEIYLNNGPEAKPAWSFGKTPKKSLRQDPNQVFTSLSGGMNTEGMGILDFENDGDLDLVVDNHDFGIDLLKNDGEGRFYHATPNDKLRGFPSKAKSGDYLAVTDYDGDGFVDLIDRKEQQFDLFRNRGDGTVKANQSFNEEASNANKGGAAFCDLDSDGDFDVVWTDAGATQVWRNDGGTFRPTGEPAASAGVDLVSLDLDDVACADVDNDGDLDLFFSASSGPSFLFFNETAPGSASPFAFERDNRNIDVQGNGEATAFSDYDRDGDLDLVVNVDGAGNQLWESHRNDAGDDNYLAIRVLRCMESECEDDDDDDHEQHNHDDDDDDGDDDDDDDDDQDHGGQVRYRDDIGATIRLLDASGLVPLGPVREVNGGRGHGTQDPALVHVGLPLGPDHRYVVEVRFIGGDGKPGPIVRKEVVPAEIASYQSIEITSCEKQNRAPVAKNVEVETRMNVPVELRLRASDPDGDPLEYFVVTLPKHGRLEGSGDRLRYVPDRDFEGDDQFTYRATDGRLESNTARVEIEVEGGNHDGEDEK